MASSNFERTARRDPTWPGGSDRDLRITREEFDQVAAELKRSLEHLKIPANETEEVLAAFAAHKPQVTEGSKTVAASP